MVEVEVEVDMKVGEEAEEETPEGIILINLQGNMEDLYLKHVYILEINGPT